MLLSTCTEILMFILISRYVFILINSNGNLQFSICVNFVTCSVNEYNSAKFHSEFYSKAACNCVQKR